MVRIRVLQVQRSVPSAGLYPLSLPEPETTMSVWPLATQMTGTAYPASMSGRSVFQASLPVFASKA